MTHSMSLRSATRRAAIAVGAVLLLAGCGGPNTPTPKPPPPPPPAAVSITCPADVQANSAEGNTVAVSFTAPVATGLAPVATACTPASGAQFAVGTTTINCTATDSLARTATCSFAIRVAGPPKLTHTRFVSFGDSITEGLVSPAPTILMASPATAYPVSLETRLRARYRFQTPLPLVINDGIGGEFASGPSPTSIGGVSRFPIMLRYYQPQVVLLMEGTNDLLGGQAGADAAIAALRSMVQMAKGQGLRVCLATIAPQRPNGLRHRAAVAAMIPGFNDRIRALAAAEGVVLVDVYNALKDNIQLYIGVDDLHPTVAGYDKIAETFFAAISGAFEEKPPANAWDRR